MPEDMNEGPASVSDTNAPWHSDNQAEAEVTNQFDPPTTCPYCRNPVHILHSHPSFTSILVDYSLSEKS